ncbi:MAG: ser/threonine protein phosphatase [Candidatus Eremiobacteraeota bacterium]|nr:ser/threonine protein phosphatase [Candidatus Eremiobacteraeota bacterium]
MILAAVLSAWVQYAADGNPHARALVTRTCPSVTYDGGSVPMRQRAAASSGFDDVVCDAPLPAGATNVVVDGTRLPSPPRAPRTIVVFGDTGCRMLDDEQQNCGDIADWPFPKIAQTIAAAHPDLLVHVGDYYYRENNCPASMTKCLNRWGDTSMSWNADWFSPGKPVFASAPLVLIRGNHEDCERGGPAWFRYLDGGAAVTPCIAGAVDGSPPWAVSFDGLRIVVADSAADPSDTKPDPARIAFYQTSFRRAQQLAAGPGGDAWFVTHRPPFSNTNQTQALLALGWHFAPFDAVLAGHVHDFEAINVAGYPPLIVNGESGDDLDNAGSTATYIAMQRNNGNPVYSLGSPAPFGSKQYGFAVYTRSVSGWTISLRDADGIERRACMLTKGTVSCP